MLDHIHLHNFNKVGVKSMRHIVMTTIYYLAIPLSLTTTHLHNFNKAGVNEPYGSSNHPMNRSILLTQIQGKAGTIDKNQVS
jgi:hypothetical protein